MFVRTWLRLQHALKEKASMTALKPWIAELMKKMISFGIGGDGLTFVESDMWPIFLDYIQKGEQGKINGKEPGLVVVGLTRLKKLSSCKI